MTNPFFLFAVAAAVLLALAFVAGPLVANRQRALLLGILVFVPAATLAVYAMVGTPNAIDPDTGQTGELRSAVADLARSAMRHPDNAEHWARLGLAYKSLEEFGSAEHAFRRALYIDNDADFIKAELGETLLYASGERQLSDEARRLLEDAAESGTQKALWLLGLEAYQREDYARAIERFEALLDTVPPNSSVRSTIEQYLATARAGGSPQTPADRPESADGPTLSLAIDIEASLKQRLEGDEIVFVAVRRAQGGPPLAVRRLRAGDLPTRLSIDDGDAMMAGNGLSSAESIVAVARVSFTGDARPAKGDFEGETDILRVGDKDLRAEITIDQIL